MSEYRRSFINGGTYFFTLVTYQRQPIFIEPLPQELLQSAWMDVCNRFPFTTDAFCILPDHLHCILTLPSEDANYPMRIREIKRLFTKAYLLHNKETLARNSSRLARGEATIWQRRYWEHTIQDEGDFKHHLNYIHYNPVKHGYVTRVSDWGWSSFHRYVEEGYYEKDWGNESDLKFDLNYGE
jgi:putative transposase